MGGVLWLHNIFFFQAVSPYIIFLESLMYSEILTKYTFGVIFKFKNAYEKLEIPVTISDKKYCKITNYI